MEPRIAIMVVGLKRTYNEIANQYIVQNLIRELEKQRATVDVFVASEQKISIPNLRGSYIVSDPPKHNKLHVQIRRAAYCYKEVVKPYMKKNSITYDFIIKTRPDFMIFEGGLPPIGQWDRSKINVRMRLHPRMLDFMFHTGKQGIGEEIVNDQFFIVPQIYADQAFSLEIGNQPLKNKKYPFVEGQLTKLWHSHGLEFRLLAMNGIIHNWRFDSESKFFFRKRKQIESKSVKNLSKLKSLPKKNTVLKSREAKQMEIKEHQIKPIKKIKFPILKRTLKMREFLDRRKMLKPKSHKKKPIKSTL